MPGSTRAKVAVIGLAYSHVRRQSGPGASLGDEAVEACLAAIADAGLTPADIDGVTAYSEISDDAADGTTIVSPQYIWRRLRLDVRWGEVNRKFVGSSLIEAHNAIAGGSCRFALVVRGADRTGKLGRHPVWPVLTAAHAPGEFTIPYGANATYVDHAIAARRYFETYGATREDMAQYVVANRRRALLNSKGYWARNQPTPLTIADYMAARVVADPLGLYDCDIPVRGCVAYILGPAEAAQDSPHGGAFIRGTAQAWSGPNGGSAFLHPGGRPDQAPVELNRDLSRLYDKVLWQPAGLRPDDLSTANVYDGFSILVWLWLEALGVCGHGEGFELAKSAESDLGGSLPINTGGGHLGEGALAGAPHYSEAILQSMGRAGSRQVPDVEYALAATDRPARGQVIIFSSAPG